ncbi:MAG: S8 family serine peptidase, partial [Candidatus Kapaibacterium sp.]
DDSRMVDISKNADWVIDIQPYIPPSLHNDRSRLQLGIDVENPINSINYQGEDEIIAVADTGLDDQHPDLLNKVVGLVGLGRNGDTSDTHGHGTHVAGSILGDGSASKGLFKGVAPQAKLYFQSLLDAKGELGGLPFQLETLFAQAYDAGARIHNNSWGSNTFSSYRVNSMEVDQYVNKQKDMLIVISAGNAGTAADPLIGRRQTQQGYVNWLSVNAPATAKNGLTVGASRSDRSEGGLSQRTYGSAWPEKFPTPPTSTEKISEDPTSIAAFSSRGPCDDYRIKPDVVAPGTDILSCRSSIAPLKNFWGLHANTGYAFMGGTSMSAPLVSGCAAIVRQYYRTQRHHLPSAALLKATLINSTQWLKGDSAVADYSTAPNYHQGFGCVNVQTAIPNDLNPELQLYFYDNWQSPGQHFAGTGQRKRFSFTLNSGGELRITMAYTDLPGRALQNNLNLFLELPDRTKTYGNIDLPHGLNQPDTTNNVETIRIRDAQAGRYLIQITASNLLQSQDFALVVTGNFETPMIEV